MTPATLERHLPWVDPRPIFGAVEFTDVDTPGFYEDMMVSDWVEHFTQGQCHALAMSIHFLTGWPIMVLCDGDEDDYYNEAFGNCCHAIVIHPSGLALDITGLRPLDCVVLEWADAWGLEHRFEVNYEGFDGWEEADFSLSDPFARALIDQTHKMPEGWAFLCE